MLVKYVLVRIGKVGVTYRPQNIKWLKHNTKGLLFLGDLAEDQYGGQKEGWWHTKKHLFEGTGEAIKPKRPRSCTGTLNKLHLLSIRSWNFFLCFCIKLKIFNKCVLFYSGHLGILDRARGKGSRLELPGESRKLTKTLIGLWTWKDKNEILGGWQWGKELSPALSQFPPQNIWRFLKLNKMKTRKVNTEPEK